VRCTEHRGAGRVRVVRGLRGSELDFPVPDVQTVLNQFDIRIPVLICRGQLVLRNPSNSEAAECFGFNAGIDENDVYDLIVVGAGPSELAAAVYGASQGLNVLLV
jgi:thioredoxin reductase (NADPH)